MLNLSNVTWFIHKIWKMWPFKKQNPVVKKSPTLPTKYSVFSFPVPVWYFPDIKVMYGHQRTDFNFLVFTVLFTKCPIYILNFLSGDIFHEIYLKTSWTIKWISNTRLIPSLSTTQNCQKPPSTSKLLALSTFQVNQS